MKFKAGLWIDHRKCVVVLVNDNKIEKKIISSNTEKHLSRIDGKKITTPFESQKVKADDRQERHFTGHLNIYFDDIISYIKDVESLFIFGPGAAKNEFAKRVNKSKLIRQISIIETSDNMTDSQIIAKVKQHFHKSEKKRKDNQQSG